MLNLLVGPLTSIIGDTVKGFVETKKAKTELKLTTIKATQKLKEDQIAGKVAWEASAVDQMKGSWKDEVSLVVLLFLGKNIFIKAFSPYKIYHRIITIYYILRFLQVLVLREHKELQSCLKNNG